MDEDLESESKKAFLYKFGGMAVGAAFTKVQPDHVYIHSIVSDPLASGAGGVIIEAIVRYSDAQGRQGIVELSALDLATEKPYRRLGFIGEASPTGASMVLQPSTSAFWDRSSGKWTLRKQDGGPWSYATGFANG